MERLTDRRNNQNDRRLSCMNHCYNAGDCINCDSFENAVDRLAAYEDAEEQGLLVRLPCKVGDTVFSVFEDEDVFCGKVYGISTWYGTNWVSVRYDSGLKYDHKWEHFGKIVFLTREEAEAALTKEG